MIADIESSSLQESDRYESALAQLKADIARGVRYFWTRPDKPGRLAAARPQDIRSGGGMRGLIAGGWKIGRAKRQAKERHSRIFKHKETKATKEKQE